MNCVVGLAKYFIVFIVLFSQFCLAVIPISQPQVFRVTMGAEEFIILGSCHIVPLQSFSPSVLEFIGKQKTLITEISREELSAEIQISITELLAEKGTPSIWWQSLSPELQRRFRSFSMENLGITEGWREELVLSDKQVTFFAMASVAAAGMDLDLMRTSAKRGFADTLALETSQERREIGMPIEALKSSAGSEQASPAVFLCSIRACLSTSTDLEQFLDSIGYLLGSVIELAPGANSVLRPYSLGDCTNFVSDSCIPSVLIARNHMWMPHILTIVKQYRRCLFVVGAAHLVGDHGLLSLLREKGAKIYRWDASSTDQPRWQAVPEILYSAKLHDPGFKVEQQRKCIDEGTRWALKYLCKDECPGVEFRRVEGWLGKFRESVGSPSYILDESDVIRSLQAVAIDLLGAGSRDSVAEALNKRVLSPLKEIHVSRLLLGIITASARSVGDEKSGTNPLVCAARAGFDLLAKGGFVYVRFSSAKEDPRLIEERVNDYLAIIERGLSEGTAGGTKVDGSTFLAFQGVLNVDARMREILIRLAELIVEPSSLDFVRAALKSMKVQQQQSTPDWERQLRHQQTSIVALLASVGLELRPEFNKGANILAFQKL